MYWLPLYGVLEAAGLEVLMVNGRQTRNVPGRKTDMKDCQWGATLHAHGLLRAGFVPAGRYSPPAGLPAPARRARQPGRQPRAAHAKGAGAHERQAARRHQLAGRRQRLGGRARHRRGRTRSRASCWRCATCRSSRAKAQQREGILARHLGDGAPLRAAPGRGRAGTTTSARSPSATARSKRVLRHRQRP